MSKRSFFSYLLDEKDEFDTSSVFRIIKSSGYTAMSWGVHNFRNFDNLALIFKVNGFKHKGVVAITYNRVPDLFNVELRNGHYNLVEKVDGVYVDQLVSVIDSLVETDNDKSEEYSEKVNAEYANG